MAQVLIRNLPEAVVRRLRALATANGRSLEAELRMILARQTTASVFVQEDLPAYREEPARTAPSRKRKSKEWPPDIPGVKWPAERPKYKRHDPIKQSGKPISEILIEDRR